MFDATHPQKTKMGVSEISVYRYTTKVPVKKREHCLTNNAILQYLNFRQLPRAANKNLLFPVGTLLPDVNPQLFMVRSNLQFFAS